MNKEFNIIKNMKLFILSLDDIIIPNKDRILRNKIFDTSYSILYYLYMYNYNSRDKKECLKIVLSNISMLDYYLEICLKKKYINIRLCEKKSSELLRITKMVYGIIKYESKCI